MYCDLMTLSPEQLAGANLRNLRHGANATLEDLAAFARAYGLPWSTGRLLVLAAALSQVLGRGVRLAELFDGTGPVSISDTTTIDAPALQAALSGVDITPLALASEWRTKIRPLGGRGFRESDERMCKRLGITPEQGVEAMGRLWGHSFSTERDLRAGPAAKPQRKGQISRQLQAELLEEVEKQ
jgi:hypothetical protein